MFWPEAVPGLFDFRIFIDAATLKQMRDAGLKIAFHVFPHLYRCGHIEALMAAAASRFHCSNFRIFIDAATLKHPDSMAEHIHRLDFRIFIDAATLKLDVTGSPVQEGDAISASL